MHSHASMNRCYRLVWNESTNSWVAVSEISKGKGRGSSVARTLRRSGAALASALSLSVSWAAPPVNTLPSGGQVVGGQATISTSGAAMNIQQVSQRAALDWQSFSIGSAASVNFQQPNAGSVALNRVIGNNPSEIYGRLTANGQVFLSNPSGIVFGRGSSVNVGSLVASTGTIKVADFMAGGEVFSHPPGNAGSVIQQAGRISANSLTAKGGRIVLEADTITLAAGSSTTADGATGGGQVLIGGGWQGSGDTHQASSVTMEAGATASASASDKGDGGTVVLWSDTSQAASLTRANGSLRADAGPNGGDGGRIETSGHRLDTRGALVSAAAPHGKGGAWLLDPHDVEIGNYGASQNVDGSNTATGDDAKIGATDINTALDNDTSVTISTGSTGSTQAGDITVNAAITKTAGTGASLTLSAAHSVIVNAPITASAGLLGLSLVANAGGGSGGGGKIELDSSKALGSGGGRIDLLGPVQLNGTSLMTIDAGAGIVRFADTVDAPSAAGLILNAASSVILDGTVGATHALGSLTAIATSIAINGGGITTIGNQTYVGPVTLGAANTTLEITDPNTLWDFSNFWSTIRSALPEATLTVKAARGIAFGSLMGLSDDFIAPQDPGSKLNVVLWADSNTSGEGSITLYDGDSNHAHALVRTGGGKLWIGGGGGSASWEGLSVGDGSASGNASLFGAGVYIWGRLDTGAGNISINGIHESSNLYGVAIGSGSVLSTTTGNITVTNVGGGLSLGSGAVLGGASGSGDIAIRSDDLSYLSGAPGTLFQTSGRLMLAPADAATSIGVGSGAPGEWAAPIAELNALPNLANFSEIVFGRSDGINAVSLGTHGLQQNLHLLSGGGTISVPGDLDTGSRKLTLESMQGTVKIVGTTTIGSGGLSVSAPTGGTLFTDTVDGPGSLQVQAGKVAFAGAVGASTPLDSLTVTTGDTAIQGGLVRTRGSQSYGRNIILDSKTVDANGARVLLEQTEGDMAFSLAAGKTIKSNYDLGWTVSNLPLPGTTTIYTPLTLTLTLKAAGSITLVRGDASSRPLVSASSNPLNLVLWADSDANGSGSIAIRDNAPGQTLIDTGGGYFWAGGGAASPLTWAGGAVPAGPATGLSITTSISTGTGLITLAGAAANGQPGISIGSGATLATTTGDITLLDDHPDELLNPLFDGTFTSTAGGKIFFGPTNIAASLGIGGHPADWQMLSALNASSIQGGFSSIGAGRFDGSGKLTAAPFSTGAHGLALRSGSGDIEINGMLLQDGQPVSLITGGSITDTAAGGIRADTLLLSADHAASLTHDIAVNTVAARGAGLTLVNGRALAVGTAGGVSGIDVAGPVSLSAAQGLTLRRDVFTHGAGAVLLDGPVHVEAEAPQALGGIYEVTVSTSPGSGNPGRDVTITGDATIANRTTDAKLDYSHAVFVGLVAGDDVRIDSISGNFADPMIGVDKPVTLQPIVLGGADLANYIIGFDALTIPGMILPLNPPQDPRGPNLQPAPAQQTGSSPAALTELRPGPIGVGVIVEQRGDSTVAVHVPRQMAQRGAFSFRLPAGLDLLAVQSAGTWPGWLQFDARTQTFSATGAPARALPLRLELPQAGGGRVSLLIDVNEAS